MIRKLFEYRLLCSIGAAAAAGVLLLFSTGSIDLRIPLIAFPAAYILLSYPALSERLWQSKNLPPGAIHIPMQRIRQGKEFLLLNLFDQPQIYSLIKNRYALKASDPSSAGLFLYIYLPSSFYEGRNAGPDAIYRHLAERLKKEYSDPQDADLIAQRNLPIAFGFRFLPKNGFAYHELSQVIDIVKKDYYRDNTRIRGVLQSKRRLFRLHSPEDNEWRRFQPYQEETELLFGGTTLSHDFRSGENRRIALQNIERIDAEKVEYPEKVPFGSLLTYAKKGEITLEGVPMAVDKLYIDRVNVLVNGSAHRKEILARLGKALNRELTEEDFYPLFNYGQRLQGYMDPGKGVSDFISSHGNLALCYDNEKGWCVAKLESGLELRMTEAYWNQPPKTIQTLSFLTTSRAKLITGSPDSLLSFLISTGTPTRGQIFAADEMIENKIRAFAQMFGFHLIQPVGTGADGCLYLAEKDSKRYYLKSPDGQLAQEEISTIDRLKRARLIPEQIQTYTEDRMIAMPEFRSLPALNNGLLPVSAGLVFQYLKLVWQSGYLCLDLTPEHIKLDPVNEKLFLIDFSGYTDLAVFKKNAKELLADRKKIEYRTPEEAVKDFRDAEKLQVFLLGLLLYQLCKEDHGLPLALQVLGKGTVEYDQQLEMDLKDLPLAERLKPMLAYDPAHRKNFAQLQGNFAPSIEELRVFWKKAKA